jgi:hypothetical protein
MDGTSNRRSIRAEEAGAMPKEPPAAFIAIRRAILRMTDAERRYVLAWFKKWVGPTGALQPGQPKYPDGIDLSAWEADRWPPD